MIRRAERPTTGYTLIRNSVLRDERLSYRARGVLVAVLSRPDHWQTSAEALSAEAKEGRDAIRVALAELEDAGYVQRIKVQTSAGTWTTQTVVYDLPQSADSQPPTTENQPSVNQSSVFQASIEQPKRTTKDMTDDPNFSEWYSTYPKKVARPAAARAYRTASKKTSVQTLLDGARVMARMYASDKTYCPNPATWLNQERWADESSQTPEVDALGFLA